MGNYENLKQSITEVIRTNGNQEITGAVLQSTLLTIISTVGANATFAGIATPATNPGTPDGPVFWLASESGTYSNFNAIELQDGLSVLTWNGSWSSQQIFGIDNEPIAGSDNLVKSRGVWSITSRLYDGTLAPITQHTGILFTKDVIKEGTVVNYKFSNLKADGTTYSSACAIGLFDAYDTRISIIGQITGATGLVEKEGEFTIPANFAYAQIIWDELTLDYLCTEGLQQLIKRADAISIQNNVDIVGRDPIIVDGSTVKIAGDQYFRVYIDGEYKTYHIVNEGTYNVSGNNFLVMNKSTGAISVKATPNAEDWILLIHDNGTNDFEGGLLYKYYKGDILDNTVEEVKSLDGITARLYDGTLAPTSQHSGILFRNNVVKVGDTIKARLSNLKADGETFSSDTGIGLFDNEGTRLSIPANINGATSVRTTEATFTIPENFAYAATLWGELTLDYLYVESGLIQTVELLKKVEKYNNVDIVVRNTISFNGAKVTIGAGYMRLYINGLYRTFNVPQENTYDLNGNAYLVVDKTSYTLSVKTEANVGDNEWILLIHDAGTNDFEGGLLYKIYQNRKAKSYQNRVISGELCAPSQFYNGNTILFTNDIVKVGDIISYSLSNLNADGTTYLSDAGIGLFDANNTRIAIVGQIGGASTLQERSGEYTIPSNFAYAAALWSGLTIHYVKAIGIDALTEKVNGTNDVLDTIVAPQFVYSESDTTFKRFLDWKGNDDAVLFGFVTDIHSYHIDEKPKVMNFLKETSKYFGYDAMICGGDLAIETTENAAQAIQMLTNFARYSKGVFLTKGNHDWYSTEQEPDVVGNGILSAVFNEPNAREYNAEINNAGCYGSFIVRDILVLIVNSCGVNNEFNGYPFGYTDEQVNYIISKLQNVQQGQNVIMFSHVVANPIGGWNSYPVDPANMTNGTLLNTIIADFITKSSGSSGNFSWDFTNINSGCKFIASIGGHTHFNLATKVDGINFIVRQGYAGVAPEEIITGGVTYPFSLSSQCCFDCIAVKPSQGQMKIFRIGAGGSAADSTFTF